MRFTWFYFFMFLLLATPVSNNSLYTSTFGDEAIQSSPKTSSLSLDSTFFLSDDRFTITSNEDFENRGWLGSGTEDDPYMLANVRYEIDPYSAIEEIETVLSIRDTTAHFIIENLTLFSETGTIQYYTSWYGIRLSNVMNGIIRNTEIMNLDSGIYIEGSSVVSISNVSLHDDNLSIEIRSSTGCKILNSNISRILIRNSEEVMINETTINRWDSYIGFSNNVNIFNCEFIDPTEPNPWSWDTGVHLYVVWNISITNTYFNNFNQAVEISSSAGILIDRCQIVDSDTGLSFSENRNCSIQNTVLIQSRVELVIYNEDETYEFYNVTVDSKPVVYLSKIEGITLNATDYSYLFLQSVHSVEVFNENGVNISQSLCIFYSDLVSMKNIFADSLRMIRNKRISLENSSIHEYIDSYYNNETSFLNTDLGRVFIGNVNNITITNSQTGTLHIYASRNVFLTLVNSSSTDESIIQIENSENIIVEDTNFFGNGIYMTGTKFSEYAHQFYNVNLNGHPLGYFIGVDDITILPHEYEQIILVDCHDIVITDYIWQGINNPILVAYSSDIIISDIDLIDYSGWGIEIKSSFNVSLEYILISNGMEGLSIDSSEMVSITNSTLLIDNTGVSVFDSSNIRIISLYINGWRGMDFRDTSLIFISGNHIYSAEYGILLLAYVDAEIIGNRIRSDWAAGIYLVDIDYLRENLELVHILANTISQCYVGILLQSSSTVKIIGNHILSSLDSGIQLSDSYSNIIAYNEIASCGEAGVRMDSGTGNIFYGNLFHHNNNGHVIEEIANNWNSSDGIGNLWDDYVGEGSYQISGRSNSYDLHPLNITGTHFSLPLVSSPRDIVSVINGNLTNMFWVVWIDSPVTFNVFDNGLNIKNGTMSMSGSVQISFDEILLGAHNLTLQILTESGDIKTDQVNVILLIPISGEYITISTISVVIVLCALLEIRRRRNLLSSPTL
ncbi:MAG: right-handed parallel beta-helix repeat-containing protein [Candidatus Thorarchaeota archaeon]